MAYFNGKLSAKTMHDSGVSFFIRQITGQHENYPEDTELHRKSMAVNMVRFGAISNKPGVLFFT